MSVAYPFASTRPCHFRPLRHQLEDQFLYLKGKRDREEKGAGRRNEAEHSDTEITYLTSPHTSHCARALALFDRSVSPWNAAWSLQTCAMRGTAKKAAMEGAGASEELERRSQYLSSLIQRTKIRGDGDQEKEVAEATIKPERRGQVQVHRVSKQEKVGDYLIAASNQETKEVVRPVVKPERTEHLHVQRQTTKEKEMEEEQDKKKKKKSSVGDGDDPSQGKQLQQQEPSIKIRAADMSPSLQKRAFRCARETLASMPKLESKRLALALKKEFDSTYGPAWHCIVGTSFGSYVTHSLGGFLYFSIDKVYILLFRTAVEPVNT